MMNEATRQRVMGYVALTGLITKRAVEEISQRKTAEKQATDMVPDLVKAMLERKTIEPQLQKQAAALLGTHAGALQVLEECIEKMAKLNAELQAAKLINPGRGEEKTASAEIVPGSVDSPFAGYHTPYMKPSDHVYRDTLMPRG